jgi:hypothetical protein
MCKFSQKMRLRKEKQMSLVRLTFQMKNNQINQMKKKQSNQLSMNACIPETCELYI